jgi:hypothetical protein
LVAPKTYQPAGICIYCLCKQYDSNRPKARLADEHIIPLAFGGQLLLPEASCSKCERITSRIETHCIEQMVRDTREHLGLHARSHKRSRSHLPVSIDYGTHQETKRVPISEHPAALIMFSFAPPGLLLDMPPPAEPFSGGRVVIHPMSADLFARADRLGGKVNLVRRGGFNALMFGRMLAKIAHAYAVAELGTSGFRFLLTDLILGNPTVHAAQLIGGGFLPEPAGTDRHEITIKRTPRLDGREFWVVRIRLFTDLDMPPHYIVAGEPI